jgi:hypothetical protein
VKSSNVSEREQSTPAIYCARRDQFAAERDELTRRWNRVANVRLVAFALAAVLAGWGLLVGPQVLLWLAAVPLAAFVVLVVMHQRLGRRRRRAAALVEINDEGIQRLARHWDALPLRHTYRPDPAHPYAGDLDLFGRASLFHLLETATTPMGDATLRDWLLAPAAPHTIQERQGAAADLAPRVELREELALRGRLSAAERGDPAPFLRWAEGEPWLAGRRGLVWAARGSIAGLVLTGALSAFGLLAFPLWALFLAANIVINQAVGPRVRELVATPSEHQAALLAYAGLLETLGTAEVSAPLLRRLQERITAGGHRAHLWLRRLALLTRFWVPASSLGHWPFQALFLWDIHLLDRLEAWQGAAGREARDWLTALGEAEALVALGTLAHDHPEWAVPEIDPVADTITASGVGHPLLPDDVRVVNDVAVGPPGMFLLVTGSNMSGKSTLLRSIGVNAVLAGAGGPVCAAGFRMPPVSLWTSVRVQDSLERGVSFFMAELQRLKQVVDAARETGPNDPRVLYLLDEILQGTNTAERQIAARRIIRFLVDCGALGAVSTHDLGLAEGPELSPVARPVHFRETLHEDGAGPPMTFDYRLRPGPATSTNALRLMDLVGLDVGR